MKLLLRIACFFLLSITTIVFISCSGDEIIETSSVDHSKNYAYHTEEVYCQRDGLNLYGLLFMPHGDYDKWPLVIYSHGYNSTHETGIPYAEKLVKKGYVVYCFDFAGGGEGSKSDGDMNDMTVFTEKADLTAVINEMIKKPFVNTERVYLMGASLGGMVTSITGPDFNFIKDMILIYPALNVPDIARTYYNPDGTLKDPDKKSPIGNDNFNMSVYTYDPYQHIGKYKNPVLIIHGTADNVVPMAYSQRAINYYTKESELILIEGAGHSFTGEPLLEAIEMSANQLDRWEK